MSDASEKPFEPTPRRIAKAKREGNVARSSEFSANVSFAAAAATAVASAPVLGTVAVGAIVGAATKAAVSPSCALVMAVALLVVGAAALAGALAGILQTGVTFAGAAPKLERLNLIEGLRRICSRDTVTRTLRATLAFACGLLAMTPAIEAGAAAMLRAASWHGAAAGAWKGAQGVAAAAGAVGLCFAIAEYAAARNAWLRKLHMSFEERKRETKDEEGDAFARGRRRALHRSLLRGGLRRVKDAAFVVVNPEHVAVALEYRPPVVAVPKVLVRAVNELALLVRDTARAYAVPVVENAGLARALYRDGRAGEPIPHAHYIAVAEVVAALLRAPVTRR